MTCATTTSGHSLAAVDVAILAGGLGTRIRAVLGETPKVLAPIAGRAFLDYLLDWLSAMGARRVVLCLGVGAAQVQAYLTDHPRPVLELVPVVEPKPLGTAGALRLARRWLHSDPVLVINGDTFIDVDLRDFLAEHRARGSALSLLCVHVDSTDRYGSVELDARGRIVALREKSRRYSGPGLINGGVYLFSAGMLDELAAAEGPSLERDFFARLPAFTLNGSVRQAAFIDIGIPESLRATEAVVTRAAILRP
jgi:NDP-sugar pyrophosphorylase family protein